MLTIQDISVQFGGRVLFSEMNFMVNKGDRIGLLERMGQEVHFIKIIHSNSGFDSGSVNLQKR